MAAGARPIRPLGADSPLVSGVRWGSLAVGLVLVVLTRAPIWLNVAWGAVLLGYAGWRTFRRVGLGAGHARPESPPTQGPVSWPLLLAELGLVVAAVATTGSWGSPFVFCLVTPLIGIGFHGGFVAAIRSAVASVVVVGAPAIIAGPAMAAVQATCQWAVELVLVAVLAGYARRLFGEAEERHSQALDRMDRMSEANDLLVSLHQVAQSLPASLNLAEVLASTATRLKSLVDSDVVVVLLRNEATCRWDLVVGEGTRLSASLSDDQLPGPLREATQSSVASLVMVLGEDQGAGVDLLSWSGLYAPLRARGRLIGLVALEHHEPGQYGRRELQVLDGFLETAALAIDNARWFARLRTIGADEERIRIARDMHDRVGQSLASLAFSLDRLTNQARGHPLERDLGRLRGEVREVLGDVRATLSDLRTDVSDGQGLVETLDSFLERVRARSDLDVSFAHDEVERLPLLQERELWRIAHEAVTNVEHHAAARSVGVQWHCDEAGAVLEVTDDGQGFALDDDARPDSYGVTGMRERADAIGAQLDIVSGPQGTTVRCHLTAA
ncbi:MAG: GAF domain-containing sensor histidine kinase [Actinomycetota bacterium]|nr:GAF domain-containing sensor histidine kinase [Actinomycetota bacterium]